MSDSQDSRTTVAISALVGAGVGILGYKYFQSRLRQKTLESGTRTAIVYLDAPRNEGDSRNIVLFELNDDTTLESLKAKIAQTFHINSPRLFQHKNSLEVSEEDIKNLSEAIIIVTSDGDPLTYCQTGTLSIPNGPPPKPWIGNMMDLVPNIAFSSLRMFKEYGPVFKLSLPSRGAKEMIFIADADLAEEIMTHPKLWSKIHMKHAKDLRDRIGDGLFTSDDDEEIWQSAHRILLPAFSTNGMKQYFEMVVDCANEIQPQFQLISDSREPVDINDWAARFTLEVIGRVAFGINFDSFNNRPDFLEDLEDAFCENLLTIWQKLIPSPSRTAKVKRAWDNINQFIQDLIDRKRKEISENEEARKKKDLITLMLCAEDPITKTQLPNDNIRSQVLTFLVAGHDSTSSAITSLLYHISSHPVVEQRIIEEVTRVVGDGPIQWNHLSKLTYCGQVIKENLRLFPPAAAVRKTCEKDTKLGPYAVKKGTAALIAFWALHYNPKHWPEPKKFDPDRFSEENSAKRNQFAWLPFSTGPRGCIGQQLSVMEQKIFLATAFRNYCFRLHMTAKIEITFPLFVKPNGVNMVLSKRPTITLLESNEPQDKSDSSETDAELTQLLQLNSNEAKRVLNLFILYGSNMETSSSYAQQVTQKAQDLGHNVSSMSLDEFVETNSLETVRSKPNESAIIIITSTYNGEPPDNAVQFKSWLLSLNSSTHDLSGINYCVFGCGNSQWKTFQMFPSLIDQRLLDLGASRLCKLGKGDADKAIDDDFSRWILNMWLGIYTEFGIANNQTDFASNSTFPQFDIKTLEKDSDVSSAFKKSDYGQLCEFASSNGAFLAKCLLNRELQQIETTKRSTRQIKFELPENVKYQTGDHLAVCGFNSTELINKAATLLNVNLSQFVTITKSTSQSRTIPHNTPISLALLFECFLDLQGPVTRSQLNFLSTKASCPPEKTKLSSLGTVNEETVSDQPSYEEYIQKPKRTLLQILEEFKSIELTLSEFVSIVPPLRPRYYSISSSAIETPNVAELTVGVVSHSTPTGRTHKGVCSNYLSNLKINDIATVFVKDTKSSFRLPKDLNVPIILVGAGTGLAPLRGFLHERKQTGATGKNVLVFGCRTDADFLYREELEAFAKDGTLNILSVAFSRKQSAKVYVQHKILENAQQIYQLLEDGAHIYVCGDAKYMATGVRNAFSSVIQQIRGISLRLAEEYLSHLSHSGRYNEDVWAS